MSPVGVSSTASPKWQIATSTFSRMNNRKFLALRQPVNPVCGNLSKRLLPSAGPPYRKAPSLRILAKTEMQTEIIGGLIARPALNFLHLASAFSLHNNAGADGVE